MNNKYRDYLNIIDFLKPLKDNTTISKFLFNLEDFSFLLERAFSMFLDAYLEEATEKEYLSIDIVLKFLEIDSIIDYMKTEFIRLVRLDREILNENAYNTLIDLICDPSAFFNLYAKERK